MGCDGGCNCDWLSRDNCQDTEWCCAGACRDYYYDPAGCSGAALLANQSQLEQSTTAESYPQGGLSSGPSYYCGGTWNGNNNWGSGYCYPSCGDQQNQQNNDGHNYEGPIQVQNAE